MTSAVESNVRLNSSFLPEYIKIVYMEWEDHTLGMQKQTNAKLRMLGKWIIDLVRKY